jgi:small subunit ribosomal protein S8
MYTDPIADYLTRVRNAVAANHKVVEIPASNLKKEITKILFDQGYILSYKFEDNAVQGSIKIALKYDKDTKESVIKISKELVNQVYVNIQVLLHSKNP